MTPEKPVVSEEVDEVIVPGIEGEFGLLPEHTPFLSSLGTGTLTFKKGASSQSLQVSGGFCEVLQNSVTVLADQAEKKT